MNTLEVFENPDFGSVRVVEVNNTPWFVGKDVAVALGYSNTKDALVTHVDQEDKRLIQKSENTTFDIPNRGMTIINESGLYSLVLSSKLPTAKKFKRWVTAEVLPSIRKHGIYATAPTIEKMIADPNTAIQLLEALRDEQTKRKALEAENEHQRQIIMDFEPKKQYLDKILSSTGTMATTQIAADYNLSARKLNQILHEEGIQHKVGDQWILYQKHMGKGYTKSETIPIVHMDGRPGTKMFTRWTQKGRVLIHEVLTKRGIKPAMDQ